jgi:hypothetical protein
MNPDRIPELEKKVIQLHSELKEILAELDYPSEHEIVLPHQFDWSWEGLSFQVVLSGMGSFAIRYKDELRYKRNPASIFYISLSENHSGDLVWQSIDGEEIQIDESIREKILSKLKDLKSNLSDLR